MSVIITGLAQSLFQFSPGLFQLCLGAMQIIAHGWSRFYPGDRSDSWAR
jgi:hypothetical protein